MKIENLSPAERKFLLRVEEKYRSRPEWTQFASWWVTRFRKAGIPAESAVHRICQDLEARLGIVQGKVAPPDYRDYLADSIDAQYGSRYKFCEQTGIDQGQLSRILAGRADLSIPALQKILHILGAVMVIEPEDAVEARLGPDEASRTLEALTA
ncbi:MAG: helix-turn-helix transcriptional regulator [Acidobacteriota bacterium]